MDGKVVVSFLLGAAAGFSGCFFSMRSYFNRKMEKEIQEMRDYAYKWKKNSEEMKKYADEMYESITGEAPKGEITKEEMQKILKKNNNSPKSSYKSSSANVNRRKESEKIENIEEEYDSIEEAMVESELDDHVKDYFDQAMTDYTAYSKNKEAYEHPEEEPGVPIIELITQWEYDNEALSNDKRNLTYFEDDDTLCDEDDEIIDNPTQYIGEEALTAFGSPDEDEENIIHVRNNSRSCDYEIERIKDSYQRQVLGIIT